MVYRSLSSLTSSDLRKKKEGFWQLFLTPTIFISWSLVGDTLVCHVGYVILVSQGSFHPNKSPALLVIFVPALLVTLEPAFLVSSEPALLVTSEPSVGAREKFFLMIISRFTVKSKASRSN